METLECQTDKGGKAISNQVYYLAPQMQRYVSWGKGTPIFQMTHKNLKNIQGFIRHKGSYFFTPVTLCKRKWRSWRDIQYRNNGMFCNVYNCIAMISQNNFKNNRKTCVM